MADSQLHSQTRQGKSAEPVVFADRMLDRALRRWRRDEADAVRYAATVICQHNLASLVNALPSPFAERVRVVVDEFDRHQEEREGRRKTAQERRQKIVQERRQKRLQEKQEKQRKIEQERLQERQRKLRRAALLASIAGLQGEARIRFLADLVPVERNLIATPAEQLKLFALRKDSLPAGKARRKTAKQYIGTTELRANGWTAAQIVRLLGAPDMTKTNPHGSHLSPMKLYNCNRVAKVERSAAFAAWGEKAKKRAQGRLVESTPENILAAIFAVNRAAKRRRDAASTTYSAELHGFAGFHSAEKRALYELKDKGIAYLASEGALVCIGIHGRLALWKGGGYRFHSTLHPLPLPETIEGDLFLAEAKPRARKDPLIKDARLLLESLGDTRSGLGRLDSVSYASARRPRVRFKADFFEEYEDDFIEDDFIEED
jgi:hypothetical protein